MIRLILILFGLTVLLGLTGTASAKQESTPQLHPDVAEALRIAEQKQTVAPFLAPSDPTVADDPLFKHPGYRAWVRRQAPISTQRTGRGSPVFQARSYGGTTKGTSAYGNVIAQLRRGANTVCSGLVLKRNVILTAAHCVCKMNLPALPKTYSISWSGVPSSIKPKGTPISNLRFYTPANFKCSAITGTAINKINAVIGRDWGLVAFDELLPKSLGTIRLPSSRTYKRVANGNSITVVGYGQTENTTKNQRNLISSPILSKTCAPPHGKRFTCAHGRELLAFKLPKAGYKYASGPCHDDSGGGAFAHTGSGKPVLIGVVSRGAYTSGKCGNGGIYTLVTPQLAKLMARKASELQRAQ